MSDNTFQAFYEELKILVEKFEKRQMQIKVESDLDYDSVKIFGEKMDSVTRAKLELKMLLNWHIRLQNIILTGLYYTIVQK